MTQITTVSFIILFPLVPALSWWIARAGNVRPLELSMPMLFIWSYLAFAYLGTLPLFFQWVSYRVLVNGVNDPTLVYRVFLLSSVNLVLFTVGVSIASGLTREFPDTLLSSQPMRRNPKSTIKFRIAVIVVLALSLLIVADYLRRVPSIAIVVAITQSSEASASVRSQMTAEFSGRLYLYRLFYDDMLKYLVFLVTAVVVMERRRGDRLLLFFVLVSGLFGAVMSGQKGPAGWLAIGMFVTWFVGSGRTRMRFRYVAVLVIVVLAVLVVLYVVLSGASSPLRALASALSRALTGQITPAYHYLRIFPEIEPYQFGRTFPNPSGILPYEVYPLTRRVMQIVNPGQAGSGVTGSMPTVFWGEIHANFGPTVASLVGLPLGLLIGLADRVFRSAPRKPAIVAFYVWTMLYFRQLTGTGLSSIFIPISFAVVAMATWYLARWRGHHVSSFARVSGSER